MLLTQVDRKRYSDFVSAGHHASFLQMWEWGELKSRTGWQPLRLAVERDGEIVAAMQVLKRSVPGLGRSLFYSPGGAALGWTPYLAFELFPGRWIARDADQKGFSRIFQFPFLFLTLMCGPVGLLALLIARERRARAQAKV